MDSNSFDPSDSFTINYDSISSEKAVCIAEGIIIESIAFSGDIFVTESGRAILSCDSECDSSKCVSLLNCTKGWSLEDLNDICIDYTFRESGQSFLVCDLMMSSGILSFFQISSFEKSVSDSLKRFGAILIPNFSKDAIISYSHE